MPRNTIGRTAATAEIVDYIRTHSLPLSSEKDLEPLLRQIGGARCVMLGEASHGTSEYYLWRELISRRLIADYGFSFIAVEGDWPDCYRLNRYVKAYDDAGKSALDVLYSFSRWPTWMWAIREVVRLGEWLRDYNAGRPDAQKAGFYGLDVYSLWESMDAVIEYLKEYDPDAVASAKKAYACFEPYGREAQNYAWSSAFAPGSCQDEVIRVLRDLRAKLAAYPNDGRESRFNAEQNALIARDAERYYRTMIQSGPGSWNVRDQHMIETLERLLDFHGGGSKGIVWAHNTHVGDARGTDMADAGMFNIGQLGRERLSGDVALIGFGSHRGHVIAADEWGAPMTRMDVPEAPDGSWEDLLHSAGMGDRLLIFGGDYRESIPESVYESRGHRAIGVVYNPDRERYGNYVPTDLPYRYDAFLYIDRTNAVHPLHMPATELVEAPETYPVGV
jgi:erythromycin esterase-like protein